MATQLVKLRNVPEDELEEIYALMEANDIEVYETSAGNWEYRCRRCGFAMMSS